MSKDQPTTEGAAPPLADDPHRYDKGAEAFVQGLVRARRENLRPPPRESKAEPVSK